MALYTPTGALHVPWRCVRVVTPYFMVGETEFQQPISLGSLYDPIISVSTLIIFLALILCWFSDRIPRPQEDVEGSMASKRRKEGYWDHCEGVCVLKGRKGVGLAIN